MVQERGWRHARKRWCWEFEDFEKTSWILNVERCSWGFPIPTDRDLKDYKMRRALGWGQHSMVSKYLLELCLSPRVTMNRSQKLINPFVPETTKSACVCICICMVLLLLLRSWWLYNRSILRIYMYPKRWPWCNGYRRRKWTRRHEFKSWTRLIAFHIALIPLGKVWIQLFSL